MLTITVGAADAFNEETQTFESTGGFELQLEHSLVSLSKWESIHEKPFLDTHEKTWEEITSYVECMVVPPNPPEDFLPKLSKENFEEINDYISRKMTATWFSEVQPQSRNSEIVTSELIYYWMTAFTIPFECENWHLNRLFTLIRICNIKQEKPKEMSRAEVAQRNRELNAQRRKMLGTKG
jgi:hypothetical protein